MSPPDNDDQIRLRLYVAGLTPNSRRAVVNLDAALDEHASRERFRVEQVDVLLETKRAAADSVIVTPTLIAIGSNRRLVIIGDLSDTGKLRALLNAAASFG